MISRLSILLLIVGLHAGDSDTLNTPEGSYNFLSLGIGATTKGLSLVQISYDQKLNQNTSFVVSNISYGYRTLARKVVAPTGENSSRKIIKLNCGIRNVRKHSGLDFPVKYMY